MMLGHCSDDALWVARLDRARGLLGLLKWRQVGGRTTWAASHAAV